MVRFTDIFVDMTSKATKIPKENYLEQGKFQIIDQGKDTIAGYTNNDSGLFTATPAIVFGDHTRILKYIERPLFIGADGVKLLRSKLLDVNYQYLYYALSSVKIENTGYNRHFKWLKESEIPLPPLDEQKRIAKTLDFASEVVKGYKAQLAELDKLVQSVFYEMFGDPVTNEKGWEIVCLSSLADVKIGPFGSLLHKADYISGGHALINPSHIIGNSIIPDNDLTISDDKYQDLNSYHLHKGDIVLSRRGEMGRCAVVGENGFLCGTGSLIIRPTKEMLSFFMQIVLSYPTYRKSIEHSAVGGTMMNLNVPIVSNLQIPYIPLPLQTRFASIVTAIEAQKAQVRQALTEAESLFNSLMQEYFE